MQHIWDKCTKSISGLAIITHLWACQDVPTKPQTSPLKLTPTPSKKSEPAQAPNKDGKKLATQEEQWDACKDFPANFQDQLLGQGEPKFIVARLLKHCTTRGGHEGYLEDSSWVAMHFPCSLSTSRMKIAGNYFSPKLVSMNLANCQDRNIPSSMLERQGRDFLKVTAKSKLLAVNPFAVQYWELPGYEDADVGSSIDLSSPRAKQAAWRQFIGKKPLLVHLWGRENAWNSTQVYHIVANLLLVEERSFQLRVESIHALSPTEVATVKTRCESLQPIRNCSLVFE